MVGTCSHIYKIEKQEKKIEKIENFRREGSKYVIEMSNNLNLIISSRDIKFKDKLEIIDSHIKNFELYLDIISDRYDLKDILVSYGEETINFVRNFLYFNIYFKESIFLLKDYPDISFEYLKKSEFYLDLAETHIIYINKNIGYIDDETKALAHILNIYRKAIIDLKIAIKEVEENGRISYNTIEKLKALEKEMLFLEKNY